VSIRVGRRTFIKRTVVSATAASIHPTAVARTGSAGAVQPRGAGASKVIVVGAGAFGAWTALSLRERGARVTLVDAYGPGNLRATSCDEQRQIRCGYGDRDVYSRWARKALELWKQREEEFGRQLFHPTGRLQVAARWTPEMEAQTAVFQRLSIPFERLNRDELRHRYPQLNFDGIDAAFFEPGSGLLQARNAMLAVAAAFERKGGTLRLGHATLGKAVGDRLQSVVLDGKETLTADAFCVCLRTVAAENVS
jgi:glycine/D-amino acid oxidase-like deaminating enzyme